MMLALLALLHAGVDATVVVVVVPVLMILLSSLVLLLCCDCHGMCVCLAAFCVELLLVGCGVVDGVAVNAAVCGVVTVVTAVSDV